MNPNFRTLNNGEIRERRGGGGTRTQWKKCSVHALFIHGGAFMGAASLSPFFKGFETTVSLIRIMAPVGFFLTKFRQNSA
jgi:hypothetical protein